MLTVTKQLRTETGHRLNNYDGRCSHLHGHSYLWEVTATAPELTDNGMILDFKDLKVAMNVVLDPLDHALVLAGTDPLVEMHSSQDELNNTFRATNGKPPRLFIWHENPTAESFAQWALLQIQSYLADTNITITKVKVWETATSYAEVTND